MTRDDFIKEFQIHESYHDFFTSDTVDEISDILKKIGDDYTPERRSIFRVFSENLLDKKVLLLGMDPYPQKGIATGFSFEVPFASWNDKRVNTSLKNMLKLIYKSYYGDILDIKTLRERIDFGEFPILPPNEAFINWSKEGVIFLNTALTVRIGKAGSHLNLWKGFTQRLLSYIGKRNPDLTYLIWGGKAEKFLPYIQSENIIIHNHPAICGNLSNPKDFMNGTSFLLTKEIIHWIEKR